MWKIKLHSWFTCIYILYTFLQIDGCTKVSVNSSEIELNSRKYSIWGELMINASVTEAGTGITWLKVVNHVIWCHVVLACHRITLLAFSYLQSVKPHFGNYTFCQKTFTNFVLEQALWTMTSLNESIKPKKSQEVYSSTFKQTPTFYVFSCSFCTWFTWFSNAFVFFFVRYRAVWRVKGTASNYGILYLRTHWRNWWLLQACFPISRKGTNTL